MQPTTNHLPASRTQSMSSQRLVAIATIFLCTTVGWFILGQAITLRTTDRSSGFDASITRGWGPPMTQSHPVVYYASPASADGKQRIQPAASDVRVLLKYDPKRRGLLRYRTYVVDFSADYRVENPTPITQTLYVNFQFPAKDTSYENFSFQVGEKVSTNAVATAAGITEAVTLAPGESSTVKAAYRSRGVDRWDYSFGQANRIRNFTLTMATDFRDIDFPGGTGSPGARAPEESGWRLTWKYPDVIGAQAIGMAMPGVLNPGPVAARITFFAPVSLLFFFAVLLILGAVRGVNFHPMNYFFFAAGFFAFQLLFAYLVDLIPLLAAFIIASIVSLALVAGYVRALSDMAFARLAAAAQFAYLVLFSYSFFFDGLTGLTITIGAIVTLALLMYVTAKIDWGERFASGNPPPIKPAAVTT
jgi:hypothetical protein